MLYGERYVNIRRICSSPREEGGRVLSSCCALLFFFLSGEKKTTPKEERPLFHALSKKIERKLKSFGTNPHIVCAGIRKTLIICINWGFTMFFFYFNI